MLGENTEILLEASKAIGLEVNPEKTKYMIMSRDQNIVRNGNIKIGDLSFEEVDKFKYLGATVTNINDTREEIKRKINMGNECYYSVSSSLLSKNLKEFIKWFNELVKIPMVKYSLSLVAAHECSRHRKDFNFHAPPSNHVRVSSTNFIQRSSKYNIKNNENSVTAAVVGSSEQAPTFRLLSRSRNIIPCATRYCEPATAGQVSSSESEHCYFGTGGFDLLFIFATVPRESEHSNAVLQARNSWASEQLGVGTLLFRNRRFRPTVHFCNSSETGTEHRLRVFENKALRKIFGAKRDEVTGEWRKLHNAELHALYSSPDIIRNIKSRRLRWAGHVACMGESRNAYRLLVGRPEGKIPLGRPRRRWEDNVKNGFEGARPYGSGRQHSLKCAMGKRCRPVCTVVQQEEVESIHASSYECTIVQCVLRGFGSKSRKNKVYDYVRNGNIKIGNLSFEEVEKFKYLGATVTNINDIREEIKHRMNMRNACYYSVEKLLSSSLLSKNLKVRIHKTVILPVVLYGCETWTLTLREEHRLRVFENKALRKIFGAKRDEVTGEWRKLHNTELHALYSSLDIIRNIKSRRLRWAGHVARMGESRNAYRVLVGRPEGKRPLGRPRRRWEDNIKMDFREVGYDDREWVNLAQDRDQWRAYVRAAMNLRVP
ncbi:hypothetical protein ANN_06036 [Periplaneta americana]|uniref:Reverse transcriptase domain-containing protein n=1 Tax=Periplaneta americana TaxID=6978 RepID=A0ABQ8TEG8_PERAM|nr:hypothetical protein ANN_06036 [Periplaneta americana]